MALPTEPTKNGDGGQRKKKDSMASAMAFNRDISQILASKYRMTHQVDKWV